MSSGIVTGVIRFVHYYTQDLFSDALWFGADMEMWTVIEPGAYFICASLTGLRPLARFLGQSSLYRKVTRWTQRRQPRPQTQKGSSLLPSTRPQTKNGGGSDGPLTSIKADSSSLEASSAESDMSGTMWTEGKAYKLGPLPFEAELGKENDLQLTEDLSRVLNLD